MTLGFRLAGVPSRSSLQFSVSSGLAWVNLGRLLGGDGTRVVMEGEQGCAGAVRQSPESWIWGRPHPGVRDSACSLVGVRARGEEGALGRVRAEEKWCSLCHRHGWAPGYCWSVSW